MATTLTQFTAPVVEPLSLAEAKWHLRVDSTAEDELIGQIIAGARAHVESKWSRQLVAAGYRLTLNGGFPAEFELTRPPLIQVSSITYVDPAGDTQTLAADQYTVITDGFLGRIVPAYQVSWPSTRGHVQDVTVNYVAGYAAKFTATTDDTCTVFGRTLTNADIVRVSRTHYEGDDLPETLEEQTDYHVLSVAGQTFELSATAGGAKIDITDTGTGTFFIGVLPPKALAAMKLLIGHYHMHREDMVMGSTPALINRGVDALLGFDRVPRY